MSQTLVKTFVYSNDKRTFVVPSGYSTDVELYMWGAGGGAGGADGGGGYGGAGAAGWYLHRNITLNPGDTVEVAVGRGGTGGASGSGVGKGIGGVAYKNFVGTATSSYGTGRDFGGGDGGQPGGAGWSGAGAGGGGATVLVVNNSTTYVAAGGGGGGGGSNYAAGYAASIGNSPTAYRQFTRSTNSAYNSWLNQRGIWNADVYSGTFDQFWTVYVPESGTYTITGSCDNSGSVIVDGVTRLSISGFGTTYSASLVLTAGLHTVRLLGNNSGGPGSIGVTIDKSGNVIFDTAALPRLSQGGTGRSTYGDGGGGGGGGGGITGGDGGDLGYDRWRGGIGGASGTSSPGASAPTDQTTPAGTTSGYWMSPVGTAGPDTGKSGANGLAVLVFKNNSAGQVKVNSQWKPVKSTFVKVSETWREIKTTWVKVNGQWREVEGVAPDMQILSTNSNFGSASAIPYIEDSSPPGLSGQQTLS